MTKRIVKRRRHVSRWCARTKRLALYIRGGFQCAYCGRDLRDVDPGQISLDHLVARSHGGGNEDSNLVVACHRCNAVRGNRPWQDYAPGGAQDRIREQTARPTNRALALAIIKGIVPPEVRRVEEAR